MAKTAAELEILDGVGDMLGDAGAEFVEEVEPPDPDAPVEDPPADPPPAEKPDDEPAEKPDPDPKPDDKKDDEPEEDDPIDSLAGPLSHDQVQGTPQFKGVLNDLRDSRSENATLKATIKELEENALPAGEPGAVDHGALFEEEEDDDDLDTMTKGERKAMMAEAIQKGVAAGLKPYEEARQAGDRHGNVEADIAALRADPTIPDSLKVVSLCNESRKHMAEHSPKFLEEIDGKPGMVQELFNYGMLRVPAIAAKVAKARSTHESDETERLANGQAQGTEPQAFFELIGDADGAEE
ncbi:MAG: hypothetical protein HQ582_34755 [Planctomycetes bacterium]|nr:hypothetical protein [Planctomycetota bacterium]